MTEQQALMRDYLEQIRTMEAKIDAKAQRVRELESRAVYTTTQYGGIGVSHGIDNARENLLARLIDEKSEVLKQIGKLEQEKNQALEMLDCIKDEKTYRVMHEHYVMGKPWNAIAKSLKITYQWANRLHLQGLTILCNTYEAKAIPA